MTCAYLAFTSKGLALARKLAAAQPGAVARCGENGVTLANWTAAQFAQSDALVFVWGLSALPCEPSRLTAAARPPTPPL